MSTHTFSMPLYFLVRRNTTVADEQGKNAGLNDDTKYIRGLAKGEEGDVSFMPIFTEGAIAQNYASQHGIDALVLTIHDPEEFLTLLTNVFPKDFTHINFNPTAPGTIVKEPMMAREGLTDAIRRLVNQRRTGKP
jgi:hypothetical protein